jgi:hypothetical protein
MLLIDSREGSYQLATHDPIRSLLEPCNEISTSTQNTTGKPIAVFHPDKCSCRGTARSLSFLSSGDVAFCGSGPSSPLMIGIEIKEISELVSSLETGRAQSQIRAMSQDYDIRYLLTYGGYRCSPDDHKSLEIWKPAIPKRRRAGWYTLDHGRRGPVIYSYLRNWLISPASLLAHGFMYWHSDTLPEAAEWISALYKSWSKPYHAHKSMKTKDKSSGVDIRFKRDQREGRFMRASFDTLPMDRDLKQRLDCAEALPSLGYERALAAAKHFKSPLEMYNAGVEEWSEIRVQNNSGNGTGTGADTSKSRRLGKVTAQSVVKAIRGS